MMAMKTLIKIFFVISSLFITSCDSLFDSKPEAVERLKVFNIKLVDSTGLMQKVYGSNSVKGATVMLKSNSLGTVYQLTSDENGFVKLSGAISDKYIVSVVRKLTEEEIEKGIGTKSVQLYKLVNFSIGTLDLRADANDVPEIKLDKIIVQSPLVISEIYACGPPGSGLYYHDKYVEVFNNSDEVQYLDGLIIMLAYYNGPTGFTYVSDAEFVHSRSIWMFPGTGKDYPINPGRYVVAAEDAIDHRINAPKSVDLSKVSFEFYKKDAPDVDNVAIPNMIKFFQESGNDWIIGGESDALILAKVNSISDLIWFNDHYKLSNEYVLDGVEYLSDPTRLDKKKLFPGIDAAATGGITFYTGKTMERISYFQNGRYYLKDDNNSSLDFKIFPNPSPEYHNEY